MSDYHKHLIEAEVDGRGRRQEGGRAPTGEKPFNTVDLEMTADHFNHVDQLLGTNYGGKNDKKKGNVSPRVTFSAAGPETKGVTEWKLDRH
eukprot:2129746-Amphidinium_carterae.1